MRRLVMLIATLTTVAVQTAWAGQGDCLVHSRAIVGGIPTENVSAVLPAFPGGAATVENAYGPELDLTRFLTNSIGPELILATSLHSLEGTGTLAALGECADVMALSPTPTFQYHFNLWGTVRPM